MAADTVMLLSEDNEEYEEKGSSLHDDFSFNNNVAGSHIYVRMG